ncbi:MAG TPA: ATP-binding cassette domain-containing protein [Chthoniobacterales bacterium]|nr:ATP-binding cassette domain-containing protein [Chthoniobacterales bacterium]
MPQTLDAPVQRPRPFTRKAREFASVTFRRLVGKRRRQADDRNLLPLLIQVLAGFTKVNGRILEDELDSSLGFLRYDYPEAVYSDLRALFQKALNEQQDLGQMAKRLAEEMPQDRKIMLGVQLYDLIAKAGMQQEQVIAYYSFMSQLGMAAQAIDIVYQLNAADTVDPSVYQKGTSPLESIVLGSAASCDVQLPELGPEDRLMAYRYHDLILFKNLSTRHVTVRGRTLAYSEFCRVYPGQRLLVDEQVISHQELIFYFNAKKNIYLPQIFVKVGTGDEIQLEKSRTRDSSLQVEFGLKVQVKALKNVAATLNGSELKAGVTVSGNLEDQIDFANGLVLPLVDLRRGARAMGGRFQLKTSKSEYLVSNNPSLLEEDDILLSPGTGGEVLLKIFCDYDQKVGTLEVLQADRPIMVGETIVRTVAALTDGDIIRINNAQILRCDFSERIIEEERNIIHQLDVKDVSLRFKTGDVALDGISFTVTRGEMVCVMGASGSGKSTLLKAICGQIEPTNGSILLNGQSLYDSLEMLRGYVAYIPQDDAFDEHLTILENLDYAAAIRSPHLSEKDRLRRIDSKLIELGLSERRDSVVGSSVKKFLSGGERKRLNIGLDMISSADVYLFDEPTSGLSSKDSEHVVEIIKSLSHNKIVLVTIHTPTSKIFQMFNKAVLVDKGGRLVFFGTPQETLQYFASAEQEQHFGTELGGCPSCGTTRPEFIFDVLETPLRDLSGDIIYEENSRGQLVPARRYSPDYWRDKYESFRLIQEMRQISLKPEPQTVLPPPSQKKEPARWHDEWVRFSTILKRAFVSKLRNQTNVWTTIFEAPILAALIGFVLRYAENSEYDFASAFHIPTYLFLALVVAMFLGLTNSCDDIIRDRAILERERNLNIHLPYYVLSKFLTLSLFAVIQSVLFLLIGDVILEIRGMFWPYLWFMGITAIAGIAGGLLISSLVNDAKTAANIVPLVLIPQIILGGALIKYEEMNRNLDFIYVLTRDRAAKEHHQADTHLKPHDVEVPLVCQLIPMRWSYEAMVVAQAKLNPFTRRQDILTEKIEQLAQKKVLSQAESDRLDDLKETLAILSGLVGANTAQVDSKLREVDRIISGAPLDRKKFDSGGDTVTAEQLYQNQKITDMLTDAQMKQKDYTSDVRNVFFGPEKYYFGQKLNIFVFNSYIINGFTLLFLLLLLFSLHRQLRSSA